MTRIRVGDIVIEPGFGQMDGEFEHRVAAVKRVRQEFYIEAGILSGWRPCVDFRWDSERGRWVHESLPLDVEA